MKFVRLAAVFLLSASGAGAAFVSTDPQRQSTARFVRQCGSSDNQKLLGGTEFLHRQGCPSCLPSEHVLTAREVRIERPIQALFTSTVLTTTIAAPTLADEGDGGKAKDFEAAVAVVAPTAAKEKVLEASDLETKDAQDVTTKTVAQTNSRAEVDSKAEIKPDASLIPSEETSASANKLADAETKPDPPREEKPKETFQTALKKYFPKALSATAAKSRIQASLEERQFTKLNTVFGTSVCPDDINFKPGKSLPAMLQNAISDLNGAFALGGLGGLPFMGVEGMRNFLSHAPTNGKAVLLYGPHVGITDDGIVGKVERLGMEKASPACDTIMHAYQILQAQNDAGTTTSAERDKNVFNREQYICAKLRRALATKEGKSIPPDAMPAFLTVQMFDIVEEVVLKQLNVCLQDRYSLTNYIDEVILIGGIAINRGQVLGSIEPREDYFQPLVYKTYKKAEIAGPLSEAKDLYRETFGERPKPFYA